MHWHVVYMSMVCSIVVMHNIDVIIDDVGGFVINSMVVG